jgi:hypothetical protein
MHDVCGKDIIVYNSPNGISKCIGDVLYVPKLVKYLLSINQLTKQGFKVKFEATKCWLKFSYSNKVIVEVIQGGKLYKLVRVVLAKCSTKITMSDLWHHKLKHVYMQNLTTMKEITLLKALISMEIMT